jgi:hypothetical protein
MGTLITLDKLRGLAPLEPSEEAKKVYEEMLKEPVSRDNRLKLDQNGKGILYNNQLYDSAFVQVYEWERHCVTWNKTGPVTVPWDKYATEEEAQENGYSKNCLLKVVFLNCDEGPVRTELRLTFFRSLVWNDYTHELKREGLWPSQVVTEIRTFPKERTEPPLKVYAGISFNLKQRIPVAEGEKVIDTEVVEEETTPSPQGDKSKWTGLSD